LAINLFLSFGALRPFFFGALSLLNLIANTRLEKKIYELLNPFFTNKGIRLIKIKFQSSKRSKLLVFLEKNDGRITIDECADISGETISILDVENIIKDSYQLEVSSAGIDRYLTSLSDFKRYQNYNVKVKRDMVTERGKLVDSTESTITLATKNGQERIDLSCVSDVKIDLEGMSLKNIQEMELI
jgi:ribosome maturation factor RimP